MTPSSFESLLRRLLRMRASVGFVGLTRSPHPEEQRLRCVSKGEGIKGNDSAGARSAASREGSMKHKSSRLVGAAALLLISMFSAQAQTFPNRQITIIVPYPPAGILDVVARIVAEGLRIKFKQPVIVLNKVG